MKFCPDSRRCYEDGFDTCLHDRAALIGGRPGARRVAQKYSLDRMLADGVGQAVYTGRHLETDRPYAIKLLLPGDGADADAAKIFRREALATAHLNTRVDHQHVAKTYDYGLLPDGTAYVVTELVTGRSLRRHMDEAGPLPAAAAVDIARQVADGLEAAHRLGVVHRDLEPSCIVLARDYDERPEAKIIDFGLASLRKQRGSDDGPSSAYVAPERRAGQNSDARSDIYSLGVILYEMLAGCLPFGGGGRGREGEPPLPLARFRGDVPEPLERLLAEQLRERPAARPHSAAEVARRLRAIENMLVVGYAAAPAAEAQPLTEGEPATPNAGAAADHTPAAAGRAQVAAPPTDTHTHAREPEPDGADTPAYDDLDELQEELGQSLDEIVVKASTPVRLHTRERRPPVSALLPAEGAARRAPLFYAALAAMVAGVACGLWLTSRVSSPRLLTTPHAASAAELAGPTEPSAAGPSPAVEAGEPPSGAESGSPEVAAGSPGVREPVVPEAPSPKGPGANTPAEPPKRSGEETAGAVVSAGRKPEPRQGGRCVLSVSESSLSIPAGGRSGAVTVNVNGPVTATTNNWPDIAIFSEPRREGDGVVRYSVVSVSKRAGTFTVNFKSPCGAKAVPVIVKQP